MKILYQGNGFAVLEIDGQLKISWAELYVERIERG